jgi:hypothetical protein
MAVGPGAVRQSHGGVFRQAGLRGPFFRLACNPNLQLAPEHLG